MTREAVNQALRGFERNGLVGWDDNRLVLVQIEQLCIRSEGN